MDVKLVFISFSFSLVLACQGSKFKIESDYSSETESERQAIVPDEELPVIDPPASENSDIDFPMQPLAWETERAPERRSWSEHIFHQIEFYFEDLDKAQDTTRFCPNYPNLSHSERINFWGQLFAAISYFESGWRPTTRFHESTMGIDPVTKNPVYSEGLLQLSYQDIQWAKWCQFDWAIDKHLSPTDPRKTIFDPYKNLSCGVGIMARQIRRRGLIVLSTGVYWAVIRENGRFQKLNQIVNIVKRHEYCHLKTDKIVESKTHPDADILGYF